MFLILGGPISISIAFADALHLYYCILFSFANIPFETCRILSISIAFAHDLPWVSLCTRNPGFHSSNPRSARASLSLLPFRIALYDECSPWVVIIIVSFCFCSNKFSAWESRISGWCVFRFPDIHYSFWYLLPRNDPPVCSIMRFRSYASTFSRFVSLPQESQKKTFKKW